jgi:hypothetical protein
MNSDNERVALSAAQTLVERAYGKSKAQEDEKPATPATAEELEHLVECLRLITDGQKWQIEQLQARLAEARSVGELAAPVNAEVVAPSQEGVRISEDED